MYPCIMYMFGYKHIPVISILFSGPKGMLITGMQCNGLATWRFLGSLSSAQESEVPSAAATPVMVLDKGPYPLDKERPFG